MRLGVITFAIATGLFASPVLSAEPSADELNAKRPRQLA